MRAGRRFCRLSPSALQTLEKIKYTTAYPQSTVLFLEGQPSRGIFVLCQGRAKVSVSARDGRTVILKITEPGEVLGLSATVSGSPYETTAVTIDPCQVSLIRREDTIQFLKHNSEACFKVAEELADRYRAVCHELRCLGLSHSAGQKLAKLLLEWSCRKHQSSAFTQGTRMDLTQEEIAQMIGTTRETVTRLFAQFKKRRIAQLNSSILLIRDKDALKALASHDNANAVRIG
jgi:CRP/FNR family transcriptional regulator